MNSSQRSFGIALGLSFAAALALAPRAAEAQRFFGQDLRWVLDNGNLAGTSSLAARTTFLSSLIGVGTEDFESFANGSTAPLSLTFPGAGTATLTNNGEVSDNPGGSGRQATSGSQYWDLSTGGSGSQFGITFSQDVAAFGVYGVDVGDFGDQLTMAFYRDNALIDSWSPLHGLGGGSDGDNDGNLNFFGYINADNLFDEIRFSSASTTQQTPDFWGFDDMTIGSRDQVQVPEPASLALLAIGFAGVAVSRRRTRLQR